MCDSSHLGRKIALADGDMACRTALPRYLPCVLAIIPMLHAADLTPPAEYEGKPVTHIRFDPPNQPLTSADLTRTLAFSPGAPLQLA